MQKCLNKINSVCNYASNLVQMCKAKEIFCVKNDGGILLFLVLLAKYIVDYKMSVYQVKREKERH